MQTEKPYWLGEAYSSAISDLDIGLVSRNVNTAPRIALIIDLFFNSGSKFLDYGGGYGMLVRLMRDKGYRFFRQDLYCENLFAKHFDITDLENSERKEFELLTAFEVFEHLDEPLQEIENMFKFSNNILFSTQLQPEGNTVSPDWWYLIPETGQHVSFYTEKSLHICAEKFGAKFFNLGRNLLLFSKANVDVEKFKSLEGSFLKRWYYNRYKRKYVKSLLESDFNTLIGRQVL
jgi:2-polyprenyl-3-methyl-5-hydroxy-6-metoxy-1,4-benzoquinol methylase